MHVLSMWGVVNIENRGGYGFIKQVSLFFYSKSEINSDRVHPEQDDSDALIQQ